MRVDDTGPADHGAERERGCSDEPRATRERVEREERERERGERDREIEQDERTAEPAVEARARDLVRLARIQPRVHDENGNEVGEVQSPDGDPLALGRTSAHCRERRPEGLGDVGLVVLLDPGVERERERARARVLRDRAEPFPEPVPLAHVRLEVDAREVARGLDAPLFEHRDHGLPIRSSRQRDDVDEPRALVIRVVVAGELEPLDVCEQLAVARRRGAPKVEDLGKLLELPDADRGADVVDPVVEPEPRVLEPPSAVRASLVPEADEEPVLLLRMRRHHPALARRDLLVGVEGEHGGRALRADGLALVPGSERLACVLDEHQPVPVADRPELVELARVAVDVDGDDGLRALGHRGLDRGGVEVERPRVHVREHGGRALVDRAVRGGDERVRARDHLVARPDSRGDTEEV